MFVRLIKLSGSIIVWFADCLRNFMCRLLGIKLPGTCVVLYYHAVPPKELTRFRQQMKDLTRLAKPASLDHELKLEMEVRHVALTFDDGFSGTIWRILPELSQRKIPVTFFVPSGFLGKKPTWLDKQEDRDHQEIVMTADELREVRKNCLVSVGSHCITHRNLLYLDEKEGKEEITRSKMELEGILGKKVSLLSFPQGAFNELHLRWSLEAGYNRIFSILPLLAFRDKNEYVTGRCRVDPTDWPVEFRLKMCGAYRWLPYAFHVKERIQGLLKRNPKYCIQRNS
jgi:peptidoglycan/xylan/chitin deacetylase (PgdA/CDA1 family)